MRVCEIIAVSHATFRTPSTFERRAISIPRKRLRIPFGIDRFLPGPSPHLAAAASSIAITPERR